MLKKIIIGCLILSNFLLAKINDYRKVFTEQNKVELNELISNFEEVTGNKLYLDTLEDNEGFESVEQEKTVILNLIRNTQGDKEKLKIQIKLSQDLSPEEIQQDLELLLDSLNENQPDKNELEASKELIQGMSDIFVERKQVEKEEIEENGGEDEGLSLGIKIFLGILLTFLILFIRILQVKRKKRKYYQNRKRKK